MFSLGAVCFKLVMTCLVMDLFFFYICLCVHQNLSILF